MVIRITSYTPVFSVLGNRRIVTDMKHRILFVVTYFDCGGINRALQNLLNRIDINRYDIDVFGMVPDGMFADYYKNCRVLPRHMLLSALMARYGQQTGTMRIWCLLVKVLNKVTRGYFGNRVKQYVAKRLKRQGYDTVVAFSEGAPTSFVRLMNHSNSVAWIHCDYSSYKQLNGNIDELAIYSHFKHVVCVAEYPRQTFLSCYPAMASRTTSIYNIQDDAMMMSLAKDEVKESFSNDLFNIVSIGRLDPVKRLSIVPVLAKRLVDVGLKFRWYVIGPRGGTTDEFNSLIENISQQGVTDHVFYLGEKENPYAYISRADLLVNTSISEGCPYVINEAKILHTPVVCTNFGSAAEFVDDGVNGFICPIETMADTIVNYMKDGELQRMTKSNLNTFTYNNKVLLEQVYQILD